MEYMQEDLLAFIRDLVSGICSFLTTMVFQPVLGSHIEFSHASTYFTRALEAILWVFLLPTLGMHWKKNKVLAGLLCRVADVEASLGMTVHSTTCALFCQCF